MEYFCIHCGEDTWKSGREIPEGTICKKCDSKPKYLHITAEQFAEAQRECRRSPGLRLGQCLCNMFLPKSESMPELFYAPKEDVWKYLVFH